MTQPDHKKDIASGGDVIKHTRIAKSGRPLGSEVPQGHLDDANLEQLPGTGGFLETGITPAALYEIDAITAELDETVENALTFLKTGAANHYFNKKT